MQHLGPFSILIFWGVIIFVLRKWETDVKLTISDHVSAGSGRKVFVPSVLVLMSGFFLSMFLWLFPHLHVPVLTYVFLSVAYFAQISTTLIPRKDRRLRAHDALATLSGTSLYVVLVLILFTAQLEAYLNVVLAASLLIMAFSGVYVLDRTKPYYLAVQGVYFFVFCANTVLLTYLAT